MKPITSQEVVAMRNRAGLNQTEFWSPLGVTQSGGSRYESGRAMPKPVQTLIPIVHGEKREAQRAVKRIRGEAI
jgi:DNA-binding transcriptional regulator YiaG